MYIKFLGVPYGITKMASAGDANFLPGSTLFRHKALSGHC